MSKVAKKSRRQRVQTPNLLIEADPAEETMLGGASITMTEEHIEETAEATTHTTETREVKMVKTTEEATEAVVVAEEVIVRIGLEPKLTEINMKGKNKETLKMETDTHDQEPHVEEVNIEVAEVSVVLTEENTEEEVVIEVEDIVVKEVNTEEEDRVQEVGDKNKIFTINPKENQVMKIALKVDLCLLLRKKSSLLMTG